MELSVVPSVNNPSRVTMTRCGPHSPGIGCPATMSPNAAMIAIVEASESDGSRTTVRITSRDGRIIAELGMGSYPVWSPDSSRLTIERISKSYWFSAERKGDIIELFKVDENSQIVSIATGLPGGAPEWNQDSLMFSIMKECPPLLCVFDREGRQVFSPIQTMNTKQVVEWSPNGQLLLVFDRSRQSIHVYDSHGRRVYIGATAHEPYDSVCWAHDSNHIAITPDTEYPLEVKPVTVLNILDNTHTPRDTGGRVDSLCWSPDSTRMLVVRSKYIDIRDGRNWALVASIPNNTVVDGLIPFSFCPKWSKDSSMIGIRTEEPQSVVVFSKNGQRLLMIPLRGRFQGRLQYPTLSSNFTHLLTISETIRVTCLVKWTPRTNNLFAQHFCETILTLMCVARRLDEEDNERQQQPQQQLQQQQLQQHHNPENAKRQKNVMPSATGLPRLPVEIWLIVIEHLQAAPVLNYVCGPFWRVQPALNHM